MSRPKPWLKLWTEWIHDPKILSLTLAEAGAWCKILTLAQELQADGNLVRGSGNPLSLEEIATCLHVNNADISVLSSMFTKMEKERSISKEDGIYTIVNFEERQSQTPSETKEAVRNRVQRYRERHAVTKKPLQESPDNLAREIRERLTKVPLYDSYLKEHEAMKQALVEMGSLKGYISKPELSTQDGRIDLVWLNQERSVVYAFEVDAVSPKYKSLMKLRNLGGVSFVILRRGATPYRWEQDVLLIGLNRPRLKKEVGVVPTPPFKDKDKDKDKDKERNGKKAVTYLETPKVTANVTEKLLPEPAKNYGEFNNVLLTETELEKLTVKFGETETRDRIERLSGGIASKGYKYRSHYATILNWARKDKEKGDRYGSGGPEQKSSERRGAHTPLGDTRSGDKPGGWDVTESRTDAAGPGD